MRPPAFQVCSQRELTDIAHLSNNEAGVYLRLRCIVWTYAEDFHKCDNDIASLAGILKTTPRLLKPILRKLSAPPAQLIVQEKNRIRLVSLTEQAAKQAKYRKMQSAKSRKRWSTRKTSGPAHAKDVASQADPAPEDTCNRAAMDSAVPVKTHRAKPQNVPPPAKETKTATNHGWETRDHIKWLRIQKPDHQSAWADKRHAAAIEKHRFIWVVAAYLRAQKLAPARATAQDIVRLTFGILRQGKPTDSALDEATRRLSVYDTLRAGIKNLAETLR